MISRRQFMHTAAVASSGATVTLILTPLSSLTGCDSDDTSEGQTGSTNPTTPVGGGEPTPNPAQPTGGCDNKGGIGSRSSVSLGHTHDICVAGTDLTNPPSGGATYTTTNNDGHMHAVTLTAAQLSALSRGETVTTQTTNVAGHTHDYAIRKATTTSTGSTSGGSTSGGSTSGGSTSSTSSSSSSTGGY